jgi:phosphoglycolate phosphatase-like HAD superfamily hydrolase
LKPLSRGSKTVKLILDFDGTLLNSMPRLARAAEAIISRHFDIPVEEAYDAYMACTGLSFAEQLREITNPSTLDDEEVINQCADLFLHDQSLIYEGNGKDIEPAEFHTGVQEELNFLRHEKIRFAVSTSSHATLVTKVFDRLDVGMTPLVYGIEYGPKSDQLATLRDKGYDVFIGDTPRDGQLAQDVGIRFMAVEHTFPRRVFKDAGFDSCIDLHSAIAEVLRGPTDWPSSSDGTYTSNVKPSSLWPARAA